VELESAREVPVLLLENHEAISAWQSFLTSSQKVHWHLSSIPGRGITSFWQLPKVMTRKFGKTSLVGGLVQNG
jgi:hypothetical protein